MTDSKIKALQGFLRRALEDERLVRPYKIERSRRVPRGTWTLVDDGKTVLLSPDVYDLLEAEIHEGLIFVDPFKEQD